MLCKSGAFSVQLLSFSRVIGGWTMRNMCADAKCAKSPGSEFFGKKYSPRLPLEARLLSIYDGE